MRYELTKEFLEEIREAIALSNTAYIDQRVILLHAADIAEIIDELDLDEAKFIYSHLDEEQQADVLLELEDVRERFVESLSAKEIANQLENLDSDDAADILGELSLDRQLEIIGEMDEEDAASIVDLLNYDEDSAGGLMQKEYIKAKEEWPVNRCVIELRRQAEEVEKVYTIYVVDKSEH